jgi:hypothetical protein
MFKMHFVFATKFGSHLLKSSGAREITTRHLFKAHNFHVNSTPWSIRARLVISFVRGRQFLRKRFQECSACFLKRSIGDAASGVSWLVF